MRLLCKIIGHKWVNLDGSNYRVCDRCHSNGWAMYT